MAPKKRKVNAPRVKKKKWFAVYAPKLFNEVQLGESYVADVESLQGRYITANLSTITRSLRKQTINMQFRIHKIEDNKAYTEIMGYSMINAAIKRLVRRGRDKIADSFLVKTKDMKIIRVKPLIVTQHKGTKSLQTAIRLEARRIVREYAFTKSYEDVFSDIADGKLQKQIKDGVMTIFPLKSIDIRMAKLEENANVRLTEDIVITEKVTIRQKDKSAKKHKTEEELEAEKEQKAATEDSVDETTEDFDEDDSENDDSEEDDEIESDDVEDVDQESIEDESLEKESEVKKE